MEYQDLEISLRQEAEEIAADAQEWPAESVARRLTEIADLLERIRRQHQGGINATMGKRSGRSLEI